MGKGGEDREGTYWGEAEGAFQRIGSRVSEGGKIQESENRE